VTPTVTVLVLCGAVEVGALTAVVEEDGTTVTVVVVLCWGVVEVLRDPKFSIWRSTVYPVLHLGGSVTNMDSRS